MEERQLTDIQNQILKLSPSRALTDRNPGSDGIRMPREESKYGTVQESVPIRVLIFLSSPWWGELMGNSRNISADACLPIGPENPLVTTGPLTKRHGLVTFCCCCVFFLFLRNKERNKKRKVRQKQRYQEETWPINVPPLCLTQTFLLPPQSWP